MKRGEMGKREVSELHAVDIDFEVKENLKAFRLKRLHFIQSFAFSFFEKKKIKHLSFKFHRLYVNKIQTC